MHSVHVYMRTMVISTRAIQNFMLKPVLLIVCALVSGCGEEPDDLARPDEEVCLMNRFGGEYCIDIFEASRDDATATSPGEDESKGAASIEGRLPWTNITWQGAREACQKKGKRLCEREEWLDACDGIVGSDGTDFTYGNDIDSTRCNTEGQGVESSGVRANCKSSSGTFDQSGNVWEWTGNTLDQALARGGSYRSSLTHQCLSPEKPQVGDVVRPDGGMSIEVGFRCCRDK